jgi:hypothetical protein
MTIHSDHGSYIVFNRNWIKKSVCDNSFHLDSLLKFNVVDILIYFKLYYYV